MDRAFGAQIAFIACHKGAGGALYTNLGAAPQEKIARSNQGLKARSIRVLRQSLRSPLAIYLSAAPRLNH